mgnify:CR=1 FL=1
MKTGRFEDRQELRLVTLQAENDDLAGFAVALKLQHRVPDDAQRVAQPFEL